VIQGNRRVHTCLSNPNSMHQVLYCTVGIKYRKNCMLTSDMSLDRGVWIVAVPAIVSGLVSHVNRP
jgi:hypothetical protein